MMILFPWMSFHQLIIVHYYNKILYLWGNSHIILLRITIFVSLISLIFHSHIVSAFGRNVILCHMKKLFFWDTQAAFSGESFPPSLPRTCMCSVSTSRVLSQAWHDYGAHFLGALHSVEAWPFYVSWYSSLIFEFKILAVIILQINYYFFLFEFGNRRMSH